MRKSRIVRISEDLARQLEESARRNKKSIVEASEEISRAIKLRRGKKKLVEYEF